MSPQRHRYDLRTCAPRKGATLLAFLSILTVIGPSFAAQPDLFSAKVTTIDGREFHGTFVQLDKRGVGLKDAAGESMFARNDVECVDFVATRPMSAPGASEFLLADGGRVRGELGAGQADAITVRTSFSESLVIPFKHLTAIRFSVDDRTSRAQDAFNAALVGRLPGQDVLISEEPDVRALRGQVVSLSAESGTFAFGQKTGTFDTKRMFGIVFAAGTSESHGPLDQFELTDGTSLAGEAIGVQDTNGRISTPWGTELDVPLRQVARIRFKNDRLVYLSDLTPEYESSEGILHAPWTVQRDRSVSGGPLSIGGRVFQKGLGVHSKTKLTYDLHGDFDLLLARIGIDDAVRPRGSVVFRVLGDRSPEPNETPISGISLPRGSGTRRGEKVLPLRNLQEGQGEGSPPKNSRGATLTDESTFVLFDSGTVTGTSELEDVRVNIRGVRRITLVVDYAEAADLSDHADWGNARVVRSPGSLATPKRSTLP